MGSEREYMESIGKIKDKSAKRANQVSDISVKMDKKKLGAIKKSEEMLSEARNAFGSKLAPAVFCLLF